LLLPSIVFAFCFWQSWPYGPSFHSLRNSNCANPLLSQATDKYLYCFHHAPDLFTLLSRWMLCCQDYLAFCISVMIS
jgi:hypothetical protein